jgi:hypothetical protein
MDCHCIARQPGLREERADPRCHRLVPQTNAVKAVRNDRSPQARQPADQRCIAPGAFLDLIHRFSPPAKPPDRSVPAGSQDMDTQWLILADVGPSAQGEVGEALG